MNDEMNEWVNRWQGSCMYVCMYVCACTCAVSEWQAARWVNGRMNEWNERINEWVDGWMTMWVNLWMYGCAQHVHVRLCVCARMWNLLTIPMSGAWVRQEAGLCQLCCQCETLRKMTEPNTFSSAKRYFAIRGIRHGWITRRIHLKRAKADYKIDL